MTASFAEPLDRSMTATDAEAMSRRGTAIVAVAVASTLAVLGLAMSLSRPRYVDLVTGHEIGDTAMAIACGLVAGILIARRPASPVGRLFAAIGAFDGLAVFSSGLADTTGSATAPWTFAQWLSAWTWVPGLVLTVAGVCLLVPDGATQRLRWLWRADLTLLAAFCLSQALGSTLATGPHTHIPNPVAVPGMDALAAVSAGIGAVASAASIVILIARLCRADSRQRRQLTPIVAAGVVVLAVVFTASRLGSAGPIVQDLALLLIPGSALLSVLRLRLYDIEIAIGRSVAWVALSAVLIAVYVGVVELASALALAHRTGAVLGALAAATLLNPLRVRISTRIAVMMYGERGDPYRALSRTTQLLAGGADPAGALRQALEDLKHRLRSQAAGIARDGRPLVGDVVASPALSLPLHASGAVIGHLDIAPRIDGDTYTPAERRLIEDLCPPLSNAVSAVVLTHELRVSRERLAVAQEAERQRVRRELHDDVGPSLAAAAMHTQLARRRLHRGNTDGADEQLAELSDTLRRAVNDVRNAIDSLGPDILGEIGLADALGALADVTTTPRVTVDVAVVSSMSAAVEAAAYRVVAEAVTNARRHAFADTVAVAVRHEGDSLQITIVDDGMGGATVAAAGVGMVSMRTRIEDLGGRFAVTSAPGEGTAIQVLIPLPDTSLALGVPQPTRPVDATAEPVA